MDQTREDRMRQRMRGAARHQVQNADFGDLFSLAIPAPEPEPEPQTESSKSPVDANAEQTRTPTLIKRTSPNTSAKRRRLNSEGPNGPAQTHGQPLSNQPSSVNRSSRRALRAPVNPDPYDLENAPSTVNEDGTEDEQIAEEGSAIETTPRSRASKKQQAPASAKSVAARSAAQNPAPPQSSPLKLLRGDEVTESPADEPGSGHRRRVRANGAVTSSALLQSALRSVDNDTSQGFLQSSSPLSRKSRKSTAGTVASASSHRTSLRRSTRLSGSPDDEVNEVASDPSIASEEAGGAHVSSDGLAQEDISGEVAETVVDESTVLPGEEAEEAQEINDTDAALHIGRKRPRRSQPALSPELSPDSPEEAVVKRPRKAPPLERKSPAKQRQPKAPRAKTNKPAAPRKKRDEDTAGAVAIRIQRFTQPKFQADEDDSGDEDPLSSTIPYASRSGVNAVDVFAQMCEEIMGKSVEKIKEGMRTAEDAATKKELRVKLLALQAFREEVRTRLLEHTIALDTLFTLKKRVREAQKEKVKLRERIIEIRTEREQVHLRMDAVRTKHSEDSKEALHNINLSAAMHDVDLAIEQGRAAPELTAKEQKTADLANLELLISRVAEQACSNGPGGGALKQIQAFNAFLERAAAVL